MIVKRLSTGARIVLKSHYGYEITKVNIFQDCYLVAGTGRTVLLGDLGSCKLSEVGFVVFLGEIEGFWFLSFCRRADLMNEIFF